MPFIPLKVDRPLRRVPWVTYGLLILNFGLFILMHTTVLSGDQPGNRFESWLLTPGSVQLHQFITYQFLHAGVVHLLGNMIFLFVFGCSLEDRLGKMAFAVFYLAGGVAAGVVHLLFSSNPVLGASGSIAAVTGAYVVLFPLVRVLMLYWMIFLIGTIEISSLLLVGFQVVWNLIFSVMPGSSNVAFMAHLGGYAFGFGLMMLLLRLGALQRDRYDLQALLDQRRRRREFRQVVGRHGSPWESSPGDSVSVGNRSTGGRGKKGGDEVISEERQAILDKRTLIYEKLEQHEIEAASRLYIELLALDSQQVLSRDAQMTVANQLVAMGEAESAATAIRGFLKAWPGDSERDQLGLILGMLLARYLDQPEEARSVLEPLVKRLREESLREMARELLAGLPGAAGSEIEGSGGGEGDGALENGGGGGSRGGSGGGGKASDAEPTQG